MTSVSITDSFNKKGQPAMRTETVPDKKIAVIGPTQSGKTCLAVGLFSTSTRDFTIETVDQDGSSYLQSLKAGFAQGNWPDPTNKGTVKGIRFDFLKKGKDVIRVSFPEFAGELLASDEVFKEFANEHFRNLAGVVLLLNPGAEAFQSGDPRLLGDAISQYKRVLNYLRDENNGSRDAFIALTITAADRIKGDLADKLESFEHSVEEISNTLETSGFRWMRFDVTVTGHLKEQDKPELARGRKNSASAPFLWLLDELDWRPHRQVLFRKICRAALAVGVFVALSGAWCCVDALNAHSEICKIEQGLKDEISNCMSRENPSSSDRKEMCKKLDELRKRTGWFKEFAAKLADTNEPEVWAVYEKSIRHKISKIEGNPEECGDDCKHVDDIFTEWSPSVPSDVQSYDELKKEWEGAKPDYQIRYVKAQMSTNVETHGEAAIGHFTGLYPKLNKIRPTQKESIRQKEKVECKLDERVENEWRNYAIPAFEGAASTNATQVATQAFIDLLTNWDPVTTNGLAAKEELFVFVTNSVPQWRTTYETATFKRKIENAKETDALKDLAALYPSRVAERGETNGYLTVAYVQTQWEQRVKGAFDDATNAFVNKIYNSIVKRSGSGQAEIKDEDINQIHKQGGVVGDPFDAEAIITGLRMRVHESTSEWASKQCRVCEEWVKQKVEDGRKRTGSSSLWQDYVQFMSENRQNPFANSIVRKQVYQQIEKWFDEDCDYFKRSLVTNPLWANSSSLPADFCELERTFRTFSQLCDYVNNDKKPERESWAYWFAKYCVENGNVRAGIFNAFQQTLVFKSIRGEISYYDSKKRKINYPTNYKRTSFAARVEVIKHEQNEDVQDTAAQMILLPFDNNHAKDSPENSCDKESTSKEFKNEEIRVPIHAFEEVRIIAAVTDYNKWIGSGPETNTSGPIFIARYDGATNLDSLNSIDLSFEKRRRNSGCEIPHLELKMEVSIEGNSIGDLLNKAKDRAEVQAEKGEGQE